MTSYATAVNNGGDGGSFGVAIKAFRPLSDASKATIGSVCRRIDADFDSQSLNLRVRVAGMVSLVKGIPEKCPVFLTAASDDKRIVRARLVLNQRVTLKDLKICLQDARWQVIPKLSSELWKGIANESDGFVKTFEVNCAMNALNYLRSFEAALSKHSGFTTESPSNRTTRSITTQFGVVNLLNRTKAVRMVVVGSYTQGKLDHLLSSLFEKVPSFVGVTYGWRKTAAVNLHFVPLKSGLILKELYRLVREVVASVGGGVCDSSAFGVVLQDTLDKKYSEDQLQQQCKKNGVTMFEPLTCGHCGMLHRSIWCHKHLVPLENKALYTRALERNIKEHEDNVEHFTARVEALKRPEDNVGKVQRSTRDEIQKFRQSLPVSKYEVNEDDQRSSGIATQFSQVVAVSPDTRDDNNQWHLVQRSRDSHEHHEEDSSILRRNDEIAHSNEVVDSVEAAGDTTLFDAEDYEGPSEGNQDNQSNSHNYNEQNRDMSGHPDALVEVPVETGERSTLPDTQQCEALIEGHQNYQSYNQDNYGQDQDMTCNSNAPTDVPVGEAKVDLFSDYSPSLTTTTTTPHRGPPTQQMYERGSRTLSSVDYFVSRGKKKRQDSQISSIGQRRKDRQTSRRTRSQTPPKDDLQSGGTIIQEESNHQANSSSTESKRDSENEVKDAEKDQTVCLDLSGITERSEDFI